MYPALSTICMVIFLLICLKGYVDGREGRVVPDEISPDDWDMIKLGVVTRKEYPAAAPEAVVQREQPVPEKPAVDPGLIEDCVAALVAVGVKKSVAKKEVGRILADNPSITTVEQFLPIAFAK